MVPVQQARDFDQLLTDRGIEHEYLENNEGHGFYDIRVVLQFMAENLVFESD